MTAETGSAGKRLGNGAVGMRAVRVLRETWTSAVSVFANRNLRLVQLALVTSLVGDLAYATAVTVWAYTVGGAPVVAVLTAARLAAAAVTAPIAAAISDRIPRRTALLGTSGIRALLVGAAATYLLVGVASPWPVYVLATSAGVLAAPFRSAQRAWMPSLARHPRELAASNATSGTLESLAVFIGPAVGGLLVLVASVPVVFCVNVVTFLLSMVLIARVHVPLNGETRAPFVAPSSSGRRFAGELSAGFTLVFGDADLRSVAGQVCAQTFVGGASKVFLVVLAVEVLGTDAGGVGFLEAVLGIGAVVGGVVAIARASAQQLGHDMAIGVLLWSLPLVLIVTWPTAGVVVLALLVVGAANPVVDINLDTIVQRMTPEGTLARVFGALDTCYIATQAVGSLVMVPLLTWAGMRWSLLLVALPVATTALLSLPRMRRLDARLMAPAALPLLRTIPWFALLAPAVQETLAGAVQRIEVAAGERVISQGEVADQFFIIESGAVDVTQDGRRLRRQYEGDFFGEIGLLHDIPRTATVTATAPTVLLALARNTFLTAITGQPRSMAEEIANNRLAFRG